MTAVTLSRIDTDKNMARFYKMDVQADLFGGFSLISEWGRIGQPGQVRQRHYSTADEAEQAQHRQWCAKSKRGYIHGICRDVASYRGKEVSPSARGRCATVLAVSS